MKEVNHQYITLTTFMGNFGQVGMEAASLMMVGSGIRYQYRELGRLLLRSNPWESEDGASVADLMFRDDWNIPACWISDRHIAVWGLAKWDDEVGEDVGQGTGVRILDADERKQSSDRLWPLDMRVNSVSALLSDGTLLYVVADTGTTVWDIASHFKITGLPNFSARLLDIDRQTLVAFGSDSITEFAFSWPNAKIQVVAVLGTK
jgi:hypothetical protein